MALVIPAKQDPGPSPLPWPFRYHGLTVGLLTVLVTLVWRMLTVSHMSLPIGVAELALVALLVLWLGWRIIQRALMDDWTINGFETYVLLLLLLPIIPAIGAKREFGQPVIWGIIAFKDYYLLSGVLAIYHWLRKGWITLAQLERALVLMAWTCLIYFYFATLFIDPGPYQDTPLAGANDVKGGGAYYRFNMSAIYFGAIYYAARAFLRNRWTDLGYALLFAAYVVVFRMDRTSMAVTAIGMAGVVLLHVPLKRIARMVLPVVLPAVLAGLLFVLLAPDKVEQYRFMFMDAMHTVMGSTSGATEVSVRTVEVAIAERQIKQHPWVGNGRISREWSEEGYDKYFGFFYPADVGWLGLAFIYGYPGMALLYLLFFIAAIYMLRVKGRNGDLLFMTCKFLLLALFLDSLTNGQLTQNTGQALLLLGLMHHYSRINGQVLPAPAA
ncbi:MAG: O-antigen ligase family protein [Flavobacteriales bacterium]|nr:O-antigen ligase family protein [Flavobacteriales bacterium]MBP9079012.1 O-antigen ligase family protein [Flavobacteriales bacterium]